MKTEKNWGVLILGISERFRWENLADHVGIDVIPLDGDRVGGAFNCDVSCGIDHANGDFACCPVGK